jgi:hypothetical protein
MSEFIETLKGQFHQNRFSCKWYQQIGLRELLQFSQIVLEFLFNQPTLDSFQFSFLLDGS